MFSPKQVGRLYCLETWGKACISVVVVVVVVVEKEEHQLGLSIFLDPGKELHHNFQDFDLY